jgi:KDO2-lipid IV(A) lauroyltransferase
VAGLYLSNSLKAASAGRATLHRALAGVEAGLLWLVWAISRRLGPDRGPALGQRLLRFLGPHLRLHAKLCRNLGAAFPDWSAARVGAVARAAWGQIGQVMAEYPHLETITGSEAATRLDVVSYADVARVRTGERPAIFVSAHLGNWELAAAAAKVLHLPLTVIYSPQRNGTIDRMLQRARAALACGMLPKQASIHALMAEIKAGRSIGVLMDQRYDEGDTVPFFGRPAPVALAPAMLAARLDLAFIPARVERLEGTHFRITLFAEIRPDPTRGSVRDVARDMTARAYALFESWIRERPEQWLCVKLRWPDFESEKWRAKLAKNPRLAAAAAPAPAAVTKPLGPRAGP